MKNTRKMMLALMLVIAMVAVMAVPCFAVAAGDTVEYPFATGADALAYAPTYKAPTTNGDQWVLAQTVFNKTDLSAATYIAYEIEMVKGAAGLDFGVITAGYNRFGTHIDGANMAFFIAEDGTVTGLTVQYAAITLFEGTKGTLLIPVSSLFNRGFGPDGLENAVSYYMCFNTLYNRDFEVKVGEVGYYTGAEPTKDTFVKLETVNNLADAGQWEIPERPVDPVDPPVDPVDPPVDPVDPPVDPVDPPVDPENPGTGESIAIFCMMALMAVSAGAAILVTKKNYR